jgi:hypothetical protein
MLLELDVYYYPDDYDADEWAELGKKLVMVKGKMTINTAHVSAFNPHDNGHCMIRLSNGEIFEGHISYEEFKNIMFEEELSRDMFVSGEN